MRRDSTLITEGTAKGVIGMRVTLNNDHINAIRYLLGRVVGTEHDTQEEHNDMIRLASEVISRAGKVFRGEDSDA